MIKYEFSTLNVARLPIEDVAALFKSTSNISILVKSHLGDMLTVILNDLTTNSDLLVEQANRTRKSQLTGVVKESRKANGKLIAEMKRVVKFMITSRDPIIKTAAIDFDFFFSSYWKLSKKILLTQIELTAEAVQKYNTNPKAISDAQIIGVASIMNEIETGINSLSTVYQTRNMESGSREACSTDLRLAASESYTQYCNAIVQAVNFMPNDALITLFQSMDELRKKLHAQTISKAKDKPSVTTED